MTWLVFGNSKYWVQIVFALSHETFVNLMLEALKVTVCRGFGHCQGKFMSNHAFCIFVIFSYIVIFDKLMGAHKNMYHIIYMYLCHC